MTDPSEPGSTALADALHRATDALPPPALPGDLWTRGRRERRRRVVRRAGAVVAAVVAAALALPALGVVALPSIGPAATQVSGYPMRINHQWVVRDLPARPGPLAAVMLVTSADGGRYGWRAVSPTGHQWRFPTETFASAYPALSADGRYLGYLEPDATHVRIRDLVAGTSTRAGGFTDGASGPGITRPAGLLYPGQSPVYFSPRGGRLAFSTSTYDPAANRFGRSVIAVVDGATGSMTTVPLSDAYAKRMIGWSGPDSVWVVEWPGPQSQDNLSPETVDSITLTDLGLDGQARSTRTLRPEGGVPTELLSQWTGPVSPDRSGLALFGDSTDPAVYREGQGLIRFPSTGPVSACPVLWVGSQVAFPVEDETVGRRAALRTDLLTTLESRGAGTVSYASTPLAVVSPRNRASCVIWAADALAAGPTGWHPFGTSTARWTWYWPELTLTALATLLAAAALVIRRRTRRRRIS